MKALHHHCIIDIQIIISIIIDIQISRPVNPASKYNQCELADTQGGKYSMHSMSAQIFKLLMRMWEEDVGEVWTLEKEFTHHIIHIIHLVFWQEQNKQKWH